MRLPFIMILLAVRVAAAEEVAPPPPPTEAMQSPPPPQLGARDRFILARGEIEIGPYLTGGMLASTIGLGIGQAAQGRYQDTGWIFTIGEGGGLVIAATGAIDSAINSDQRGAWKLGSSLLLGGLVVFAGFRVWDTIDSWIGPPRHNRRYHELHGARAYVVPAHDGGAIAGLATAF